MAAFYYTHKNKIEKWLVIIGFVLGLYVFISYLFSYIAPFVIAFVISLLLEPLVSFMQKRFKLNRGLLSFFSVAITAAIIIFVGTRLVISIAAEATALLKTLPELIEEIRGTVANFVGGFQNMIELIPEDFQSAVQSATDGMINSLAGWATSLVGSGVKSSSSTIVKNLPGMVMSIFFCVISTFFLIKDKKLIRDYFVNKSHPVVISNFKLIKKGVQRAVGGYVRAQLIIMTFTAIISITGLTIMNYQYALLIGLIIMLLDALPIFGSGTILLPWVLYNLITGNVSDGIGLLIIYGIITLTRQMLEPKILGEQIGIYPLATLVSIYVGFKVFGALGFIIGPVLVVIIIVLNDAWELKNIDNGDDSDEISELNDFDDGELTETKVKTEIKTEVKTEVKAKV